MNYYVVNLRTGVSRHGQGTHIMKGNTASVPSIGSDIADIVIGSSFAGGKRTMCGRSPGRGVDVFGPGEVSCRECKRRWQLETAAGATKSHAQRQAEAKTQATMQTVGCLFFIVLIIVFIILYFTVIERGR